MKTQKTVLYISIFDDDTTCHYNLLIHNIFQVKESTISRTFYTHDYDIDLLNLYSTYNMQYRKGKNTYRMVLRFHQEDVLA